MRALPLTLVLAALGAATAPSRYAESSIAEVLVTGATVIDVNTGAATATDIHIKEDRIVALAPRGTRAAPEGARVIDAAGLYAIPGLWDMHMHVTAVPEMEDRIFHLLIANGVTSVRDTGGAVESVLAMRGRANRSSEAAPRVWVAGPVIDGSPRVHDPSTGSADGGSLEIKTPQEAISLVDSLAERGVDFIKPYEMLSPEVFRALVERAHFYGLPATGHIPIRMTTPQALAAGLDGIEHIRGMEFDCAKDPERLLADRTAIMDGHVAESGNRLRRKVHADVRPVALETFDPARCAALIRLFAEQGTWHTPTLHILAFRALRHYENPRWFDALRYLPESRQAQWRERLADYTDESKYTEWRAHGEWAMQIIGQMSRAGVRILAGTDAPGLIFMPGFTLHDELSALARAGLSPLATLRAATIDPARFFGKESELGSIEPGRRADIVLLQANPLVDIDNSRRIATVISRGRVYDRAALDAMLAAFDGRKQ